MLKIIYITENGNNKKELIRSLNGFRADIQYYPKCIQAVKQLQLQTTDFLFIDIDKIDTDFKLFRKIKKDIKIIIVSDKENQGAGLLNLRTDYISSSFNDKTITRLITTYKKSLTQKQNIYIQTIPCLKVYLDGKEIVIKGTKTRELFAYLIDNNGNPIDRSTIVKNIWPEYYKTPNGYKVLRNTCFKLKMILKSYGIIGILKKQNTLRYLNNQLYTSDILDIFQGKKDALKKYTGQYLEEYPSWNKYTKSTLNRLKESEEEDFYDKRPGSTKTAHGT